MKSLQAISQLLDRALCDTDETYAAFQQRLLEGQLTRDENPATHLCVYFLPYNPESKEVFIIHHKKSGLWLAPGGHIDVGETPFEALNREIAEELGVVSAFSDEPTPFLLTLTHIENPLQTCKAHFDIWYLFPTDGSNFEVNPREFHDAKWLSFAEARMIVTDKHNLTALKIIERL